MEELRILPRVIIKESKIVELMKEDKKKLLLDKSNKAE